MKISNFHFFSRSFIFFPFSRGEPGFVVEVQLDQKAERGEDAFYIVSLCSSALLKISAYVVDDQLSEDSEDTTEMEAYIYTLPSDQRYNFRYNYDGDRCYEYFVLFILIAIS
jgi:hypothetical protein